MSKKGQLSLFIVVAIILVVIIVAFFIINKKNTDNIPAQIVPVYNSLKTCISNEAIKGINEISLNGGYYKSSPYILNDTVIYFNEGKNTMPSKQDIENQLNLYLKDNFMSCNNSLSELKDYKVNVKVFNPDVKISPDVVYVDGNATILVTKGENTYTINKIEGIKINSPLSVVYDSAKSIIEEELADRNSTCMSCIYDIGLKNNITIGLITKERLHIFFIEPNSNQSGEYVFKFGGIK